MTAVAASENAFIGRSMSTRREKVETTVREKVTGSTRKAKTNDDSNNTYPDAASSSGAVGR